MRFSHVLLQRTGVHFEHRWKIIISSYRATTSINSDQFQKPPRPSQVSLSQNLVSWSTTSNRPNATTAALVASWPQSSRWENPEARMSPIKLSMVLQLSSVVRCKMYIKAQISNQLLNQNYPRCASETTFVCRSFTVSGSTCTLSHQSQLNGPVTDTAGTDSYDALCLSGESWWAHSFILDLK